MQLPSRDEDLNLLSAAALSIGERLDACLDARAYLHADLLADPLEAKSFGITAANAADVLERRLQLLELALRKIGEQSEAGSVNERPLCALGLGRTDLWKGYIPLALLLKERLEEHRLENDGSAFVLGINAPPGSGKSTLVQVLLFLLSVSADRPLRAVQLSSDDLYMGKAERAAAGISTRLDPRAIDPAFHGLVGRLKRARAGEEIELPRFNKGKDERERQGCFVSGPFDLVLYEGWRVGVDRGELRTDGGEGGAFDYTALNAPLDFLVYIDADLASVWGWKQQSSRRDHEREVGPWGAAQQAALEKAWSTWMVPFIENFERPLTAEGGADLVLAKSSAHEVLRIDLRSQLRRYYDLHLAADPSMSNAAGALRAAFGRAALASSLLQRSLSTDGESAEDRTSLSVSFDAFADAAEAMLSSSGAWAEPVWHRLLTSAPSSHPTVAAAGRAPSTFRCAAASVSGGDDAAAAAMRLAADLGGPPSLLLVYAPSAAALERATAAVSSTAACAGAPVHGCTSCLGTLHGGSFLGDAGHTSIFGIRDEAGRYCTAATTVDGSGGGEAWHRAAANAARDALDQGGAAAAGGTLPLVLLHATPGFEEAVLAGIASVLPGATVVGGSAADGSFDSAAWRLASGSVTLAAPAIAIALLWPSVPYSISLSCMHVPAADGCAAVVTGVADGGRRLLELDGLDAREVYSRWSDASFDLSVAPETRTTLQPLARSVTSANGVVHHFPLHPHGTEAEGGGLGLLAAAREGETLSLLSATHEMLVHNTKHAAARASAAAAGGASGVVAIVCAGVALELERSDAAPGAALSRLAGVIHDAVATGGGASPPPLVGCFTFGEQGPLASEHESCHANLMLNVLVFGGAADDGGGAEEGGAAAPLSPSRLRRQGSARRHVVV